MAIDGEATRPPGRSRKADPAAAAARELDRRRRIVEAFIEEVGTVGLSESRITDISRRAGVSNRSFYATFADKEACYLYAFEERARAVTALAKADYDATEGPWEARIRAGLSTVTTYLVANPVYARFSLVERAGLTPEGRARVKAVERDCQRTFESYESAHVIPQLRNGMLGAILGEGISRPMRDCVEAGELEKLPGLAARLTYFIAYLMVGKERAERELEAALQEQQEHGEAAGDC